ncbi:O-methyltransferase [Wenzhouxiangella sp. EGI_FJ10409]|uniref:O-methyltransferase n=1 Tax=Wenzhouxiangella sp. EGI_FJ10409 TaxID=3243767 RepID=UPI0035D7399E
MKISLLFRRMLPPALANLLRAQRERIALRGLEEENLEVSRLSKLDRGDVDKALHDRSAASAWEEFSRRLDQQDIVTHAGGVNPGDRRAIFHMIHHFRPKRVLEVGTHIGASTICIAGALDSVSDGTGGEPGSVTTVDVIDVNDSVEKPWLNSGSSISPRMLLESMGVKDRVEFVCSSSLEFLSRCTESFDFIFLDGDHHAKTVYQEIPLACARLKDAGMILLHDFYPGAKPLWRDRKVLPGPYLAVDRHMRSGSGLRVFPMGELPWPTKQHSRASSLALLGR